MIGLIGYGIVGKAIENTLSKKFDLKIYDKFMSLDKFESLIQCKFIFVAVPTPFDCSKNQVDQSAVLESLKKLEELEYSGIVIIKSTLAPGTCDNYSSEFSLNIVFNPEFLRESTTPNEDFENQDTVVIGSPDLETYQLVESMFREVLLPEAVYYFTSTTEAEMIKCAQNTMLASRVALANMIFDACIEHDINYDKIKGIAFDNFEILGPHMTLVPGPDGKRGFGGKCLPKDIRAFSTIHNSKLLKSIIDYNDTLREDLDNFLMNYQDKD